MNEWSSRSTGVELLTGPVGVTGKDPGTWRAELDGHHCRTTRQCLIEIGVVLGFPDYYGRNWDAFFECFADLLEITEGGMGSEFNDRPGRPERTLHLLVHNAEELLVEAGPRDLGLLLWRLRNPYDDYDPPQLWHRYAGLRVTLVCAAPAMPSFEERVRAACRVDPTA